VNSVRTFRPLLLKCSAKTRAHIRGLESLSTKRSKRYRWYLVSVLLQHYPHCFSTVILRSRRHVFPETLLRLFCIHRYWRCDCNCQFYRFRTPFVKTLHAVKPRSAWRTLLHHIFFDLKDGVSRRDMTGVVDNRIANHSSSVWIWHSGPAEGFS
jgi:hypothetical protein